MAIPAKNLTAADAPPAGTEHDKKVQERGKIIDAGMTTFAQRSRSTSTNTHLRANFSRTLLDRCRTLIPRLRSVGISNVYAIVGAHSVVLGR
jgi:hypothetical protein